MLKTIKITSCADCPFFNNEYCNLSAGFILNYFRRETLPENCPLIENTVEDVPMEVIRGLRVKATLIENFNEIKAAGSKYIKPDENKGIKEAKTHLSDKGLFEIMESVKDKDGVHLKNLF